MRGSAPGSTTRADQFILTIMHPARKIFTVISLLCDRQTVIFHFNCQGGILIDLAFTDQGGWLAPVGTLGTLWYVQLGLVLIRWYLQLLMEESITWMTPDSNDVLAWL